MRRGKGRVYFQGHESRLSLQGLQGGKRLLKHVLALAKGLGMWPRLTFGASHTGGAQLSVEMMPPALSSITTVHRRNEKGKSMAYGKVYIEQSLTLPSWQVHN